MQIEEFDGTLERQVITGAIISRQVLARVAAVWKEGDKPFASRWSNLIASWCVDFFKKHDAAPGKTIESLYAEWAASNTHNKDEAGLIETYLTSLSGDYEALASDINASHTVGLAGKLFKQTRLKKLHQSIEAALARGDEDKADACVETYRRVSMGTASPVEVLEDDEALRDVFDQEQGSVLIRYRKALGKFWGDTLARGSFIALVGVEKRGKTFNLMDMSWHAITQRRKTIFFELGDLTQNQLLRRYAIRAAQHPWRPCTVKYPLEITGQGEHRDVRWEERVFNEPLDYTTARQAFHKVKKNVIKGRDSYLKMRTAPAGTLTAGQIREECETLASMGWVPDCVFVDYADLIHNPQRDDFRHGIDQVWTELRALSTALNCLVVTASQANRAAYKAGTLSLEHNSEDKRKAAHVTGMVGLNQTSDERDQQLMRLNWMALREHENSSKRCVYVAQCLALANPAVCSSF